MIVRMCDRCGACVTPDVCNKQEMYLYKHMREISAGQNILKTVTIDLCESCYNELENWLDRKKAYDEDDFQRVCKTFENFEKLQKFGN